MINSRTFFFLILVLIAFTSCKQAPKPVDKRTYIIDSSITQLLDKKLNSPGEKIMTLTDIRLYKDDKLVEDTYTSGESIKEGVVMISLTGDIIYMYGFLGTYGSFGYNIVLFKDSCAVGYFAKSDSAKYKLKREDSLELGILVHCKTSNLTLPKKPKFQAGEFVEGIIELTSEDYYEVVNGKESRCRMQLKSYFRTNPILELYMPKGGN